MDSITLSEIRGLAAATESPRVSVFLSTHPRSHESESDVLRLRHVLDEAEQQLIKSGLRSVSARAMLEPARALPEHDEFWEKRTDGLAILATPTMFRAWRLQEALPEQVFTGNRFHLKPLVGHVADGRTFLLLALSENHVRLFEGTEHGLVPVAVPHLADGRTADLHIQGADRGSQVHASGRVGGSRRQSAIFHGQGGKADTDKEELSIYCHDVNVALHPVLNGRRTPLIVAAVGALQSLFAEKCTYPHLVKTGVEGSPDHWTESELLERALPVVQPLLDGHRRQVIGQAVASVGSDAVTSQISEILRAAVEGRVGTLVLSKRVACWGKFDLQTLQTDLHLSQQPGDDDLTDLALQLALKHGGEIVMAEPGDLPEGCEAIAIFRY